MCFLKLFLSWNQDENEHVKKLFSSFLKKRRDKNGFFVAIATFGYENQEWEFECNHSLGLLTVLRCQKSFVLFSMSEWVFQQSLLNQTAGLVEAPLLTLA